MSMQKTLRGRAWVYGDNIDTDVIIPARRLSLTRPADLAKHCMEDIDPEFAEKAAQGDIVVGGENFGCGSSREHAPLAFIGAGIGAVAAASFARIFFRNAINVGLPILECPELAGNVAKGDVLEIVPEEGTIRNHATGRVFTARPFPPFLGDLIGAGGLVEYVRRRLAE